MEVEGEAGALVLRASSSSVISPGFMAVYSGHALKQQSQGGAHSAADGDREAGDGGEGGEDAAAEEGWDGQPQGVGTVIASIQVTCRKAGSGLVLDAGPRVAVGLGFAVSGAVFASILVICSTAGVGWKAWCTSLGLVKG